MKNQPSDFQGKKPESRQLIITLKVAESTLIKIEAVDKSGKRHDLSNGECAALIGEYEMEELFPVEELAYFPEFGVANGDLELGNIDDEFEDDREPVVVRRIGGRRLVSPEMGLLSPLQQMSLGGGCQDRCSRHWEIVLRVRMLVH